jgi:hypothetical protein
MKNLFSILSFYFLFSSAIQAHQIPGPGNKNAAVTSICAIIGGEIGQMSKGCKGFGFGCLSIDVDVTVLSSTDNYTLPPGGKIKVCLNMPTITTLQINFTPEAGEKYREFYVEKNILLSSKIAQSLGRTSIIALAGIYPVKWETNGTVTATIKVASR